MGIEVPRQVSWVFPLIATRFIVPQEFTKIQRLLLTLQEPARNAYTCTVAIVLRSRTAFFILCGHFFSEKKRLSNVSRHPSM